LVVAVHSEEHRAKVHHFRFVALSCRLTLQQRCARGAGFVVFLLELRAKRRVEGALIMRIEKKVSE
jgi:hypothetical protein